MVRNIFRRFFQVITKISVNLIAFILKPENIQCRCIKFISIGDVENPMGINLLHSTPKVPKNKKALREKGFKNMGLFILLDDEFSCHCFFTFGYLKHINAWNQSGYVQGVGGDSLGQYSFAKNIVYLNVLGSIGFRGNINFTPISGIGVHFETLELLCRLIVNRH